ncbi:DUF6049 family protein [Gryllotalpicola reticulitermitis]|uniref:DUF6049 family protein n=1 Tax=Gryllotalpicola reticulitermitis TaxID=1184153 RepID=A0ABV8Q7H7_9MICO
MRRRTLLTSLIVAATVLPVVTMTAEAQPSHAAQRTTIASPASAATSAAPTAAATSPTVQVYAAGDGIVSEGSDLALSIVITNPSDAAVAGGKVTAAVTDRPIATTAALSDFEESPKTAATRTLGSDETAGIAAGATAVVGTITVPKASVRLPASTPGVFGLTATVTTTSGSIITGVGTLVVAGTHPATVGVAAVMPITTPPSTNGLISAQDLASDTGPNGVLSKELEVARRNPGLTLGIDPMILASVRVLGQAAPASAQAWLLALDELPNPTFPLQYGDADPGLQIQTGLAKPLGPLDFTYAMSASNLATPPTIGEPDGASPAQAATPTPSPTSGPQLLSLAALTAWPYSLGGIAWPAPSSVRAADLAAFSRAGLPTTIVSGGNTNAASLAGTPDAALSVNGGTALVTDDAVSSAMIAVATASGAAASGIANAQLNAQLALAAQNAQNGGVIMVSLGRIWPTDTTRTSSAIAAALDSRFSRESTVRDALTAPPTAGLKLVDKTNPAERVKTAGALLDLAGETRAGGAEPPTSIAAFSTALTTPVLLTGDIRARVLDLLSVGWGDSSDWAAAASKQIASMNSTLSAVQIASPGSIRQASHQALIPITVINKLAQPVDVVLRATPSSARLDVASDTEKTIPAGSSTKVLVPVKAQLSNGTVWLSLQLYSTAGVRIGDPEGASIVVHADWEGIGALIFGLVVLAFFGFGLVRTIQRRRRERAQSGADTVSAAPLPGGGAERGE